MAKEVVWRDAQVEISLVPFRRLYFFRHDPNDGSIWILLYVDEILQMSSSEDLVNKMRLELRQYFPTLVSSMF